jgi:hypothetical protein
MIRIDVHLAGENLTNMPHAFHARSVYGPRPYVLVFFASARYKVVKIMCSCSEVVLRTTKHTMVYPSSGPSLEVIALRPAA